MSSNNINEDNSVFKKVVSINRKDGTLKTQFTIDLNSYDTSKMEGHKEGDKVYTGFSCALKTLKPSKNYPRQAIHIDPSNSDIREAIFDMYAFFDEKTALDLPLNL